MRTNASTGVQRWWEDGCAADMRETLRVYGYDGDLSRTEQVDDGGIDYVRVGERERTENLPVVDMFR